MESVANLLQTSIGYSAVSEVGALAYFELKLRKIICRFPTHPVSNSVFNIHAWTIDTTAVGGELVEYSNRSVILGFPISISSCVGTFRKTETYCWVRKQVRPKGGFSP